VETTGLIFQRSRPEEFYPYLRILGVYGLVFTTLSLLLFDHVVEE